MLEWSNHLTSKVVPPSERAYYQGLTEAYNLASQKLLATDSVLTKARLNKIIKEITDELYAINAQFKSVLPYDVIQITEANAAYLNQELQLTLKTDAMVIALPTEAIKKIANISAIDFYRINADGVRIQSSTTVEQMLNSIAKSNATKVRGIILAEYASGSSMPTIVSKFRPYMTTKSKQHIRTVTRTLLTEASSKAQQEFYSDNSNVIDGYMYSAVLDSSTSRLCASLDGKRFKTRRAWYTPPLHPNCRSMLIAVPDGYEVGQRPIVLKDGTVEVVKDKNFTYADALKRYPQLSNKKLINVDQYINGLGMV